jgi:hypothetical protein
MKCCRNEWKEVRLFGQKMDIDVDGRSKQKVGTTVITLGRKPASATFCRSINQERKEGEGVNWMGSMPRTWESTKAPLLLDYSW